ncbi:MAG: hypothetical protein OSA23_14475 [Rhodospirillales bacterium]|nr:hypothetical protein [Rhodospirillales bacterium]
MYNVDLIRYIKETAGEMIGTAEMASPTLSSVYFDEAAELLALGALLLKRRSEVEFALKEAA